VFAPTRSAATWVAIGITCLAILLVPLATGAKDAVEGLDSTWIEFGGNFIPRNPVRADRDCTDFPSRAAAQRFFIYGHPHRDRHGLDRDGDGIACEGFDY
jgi:hypothetical protein